MANIVQYKDILINLDYVVRAYRDDLETTVELSNDVILKLPCETFDLISGENSVIHAFPVDGLYATYVDEDGLYQEKVMFMGVCANGHIRPMNGLQGPIVSFMDIPSHGRYFGLTADKLDESNNPS